ncbi:MAG: FAD-dependent monooxygenase [Chloroflexi bacterium]|nr:FAD-dependent monooxygenase [Chloroflexota bacterium]
MRYDVIVVGAGPAGSTTARECASRGLSVLMLDKAEFPRDKPCGGGVTIRAADLLPFDLTSVTERTARGLHFSFRQDSGFDRASENDLIYLTQRLKLDQLLVEKAVESGASLHERCYIRSVERHPTRVVVRANGCSFEGSVLVGADGANGVTARLSGMNVRLAQGIAMEGNITPRGRFPSEWEHRRAGHRVYSGRLWMAISEVGPYQYRHGRVEALWAESQRVSRPAGAVLRLRAGGHLGTSRTSHAGAPAGLGSCGRQRPSGRRCRGPAGPFHGRRHTLGDMERPGRGQSHQRVHRRPFR